MPAGPLAGRTAIVTGAAGGIGHAIAELFFLSGASVVIADRRGAAHAAATIDPRGERACGLAADVTDEAETRAMVADTLARFGRCDILVNNAAAGSAATPRPFPEFSDEEWRTILETNVLGLARCCRAVVPAMVAGGGGRIVNIASASALKGIPDMLPYVASKGAVLAMTKSLARELGPQRILVNAVAPGLIHGTPATASTRATAAAVSLAGRVLDREGRPADVASAVLFFATAESGFVTGQTLVVDGGTHLH